MENFKNKKENNEKFVLDEKMKEEERKKIKTKTEDVKAPFE